MSLKTVLSAAFLSVAPFAATLGTQQPGDSAKPLIGRIYDEYHRPIAGVEVIVNRKELRASSNARGVFLLEVRAGDSTLGFRRIGYRPLLVSLDPQALRRDTVLVQLVTSEVQLPDLIVSAAPSKPFRYAGTTKYDEVFLRRRIGLGSLITREDIDRHFGVSTPELLQGIPGIHYHNGPPKRLRFARCAEPNGITVFIDGFRQIGRQDTSGNSGSARGGHPRLLGLIRPPTTSEGPEIELLERVNPSDIEMIEVYRGASEIPGVFHWNGCAVVAVWTRWNR